MFGLSGSRVFAGLGVVAALLVAVAPAVLTTDVAAAATNGQVFTATLVGTQEVPPNASPATGLATVTLSSDQTTITVDVSFAGLTAPATASHIHGPAAPGSSAPVLFPFANVPVATSGVIPEQSFPITPAEVTDLQNGQYYVNVHSSTFPSGEIRGWLTPDPDQPAGLDHFACYGATPIATAGQTFPGTPATVGLQDEFGTAQAAITGPASEVCNPAEKILPNGQVFAVQNPAAHLVCWPIQSNTDVSGTEVNAKNQFGTGDLVVGRALRLCVPSWKVIGTTPPPIPDFTTPPGLDHFECYSISSGASGSFANRPNFVLVNDEFGTQRHLTLGDATQVCNPVAKTVPGNPTPTAITNPDAHLVCFDVTAIDPPVQNIVTAVDQFGTGTLAVNAGPTTGLSPFCLPSFKTIVPPPTTPEAPLALALPLSAAAIGTFSVWLNRRRRTRLA
jgi:hypothetical protein